MSEVHDVIILGAGTAGLAALREVRKRTDSFLIVNADAYGTTCARVGCMPSKALIEAANAFARRGSFEAFGIRGANELSVDVPAVLRRVRALRDDFVSGVLKTTDELGDRSIAGRGRLAGPTTVVVDGRELHAKQVVLATGSRPILPKAWEAFGDRVRTTDSIFELEDLPRSRRRHRPRRDRRRAGASARAPGHRGHGLLDERALRRVDRRGGARGARSATARGVHRARRRRGGARGVRGRPRRPQRRPRGRSRPRAGRDGAPPERRGPGARDARRPARRPRHAAGRSHHAPRRRAARLPAGRRERRRDDPARGRRRRSHRRHQRVPRDAALLPAPHAARHRVLAPRTRRRSPAGVGRNSRTATRSSGATTTHGKGARARRSGTRASSPSTPTATAVACSAPNSAPPPANTWRT